MKRKHFYSAALIVLLVLLLWQSYGQTPAEQSSLPLPSPRSAANGPELPSLPEEAAGLLRVNFYSGEPAMRDIVRLHNSSFPMVEGLIAFYEGVSSEATVWVSVSPDEGEAAELMELMVTKMPDSPVFNEKETFEAAGNTIYYVTGMGMDHFYWLDQTYVYWLAVTAPAPLEVLQAFLTN